jgi:hypothetical protein
MREVRNTITPFIVFMYKEALFSTNDLPSILPRTILDLWQNFDDVFPDEVSLGLSPARGIKHQIDLLRGATHLNRLPYRTNPEETKEI